jgi:flavin reductase (DIM6/NTAB) family NADH-FMN oxidoreductase RutF
LVFINLTDNSRKNICNLYKGGLMTVTKKIQNLILPLPVTLATHRAKKGDESTDNIISLSWVGIVEHHPNMVNIVIGRGKYSAQTIAERKEFGLCIASVELMEQVDRCGYTHGSKVDKFKMAGFTKVPAEKIDVSLIEECPICLECIVSEIVPMKTHDIFLAEVVASHINPVFLNEKEEPDLSKMNILCYANDQYWAMGDKLQDLYYSKKS